MKFRMAANLEMT